MLKFNHKIIGVMAGFLLSLSIQAADKVVVNPNHPNGYTVQAGDTLWDIAGHFLKTPWRWPDVWQGNPQISNPHLIFPGDIISLSYDGNGKPILSSRRGGMVKLSPRARIEELSEPIPTIPLDVIRPFLTRPYVVEVNGLDDAPYVLGFTREHILGATDQKLYIRDSDRSLSQEKYHVVRPGKIYKHVESGEVLGQEARYIGAIRTVKQGDPATAIVTQNDLEIIAGDRLIPVTEDRPITQFQPSAPDHDARCSIISVINGVSQIGQYNIVAIDCGQDDGMNSGHVLTIDKRGKMVKDPYYKDEDAPERRNSQRTEFFDGEREYWRVEKHVIPDPANRVILPDEPIGTLMVFRTFPRISFALILKATDAIHVLDKVRNPVPYE